MLNFGFNAKEAYIELFVNGYYVTASQAYTATSNAVWQYLYECGVSNNNSVITSGLADNLLAAAENYTILNEEPSSANVSVTGGSVILLQHRGWQMAYIPAHAFGPGKL